MKWIVLVAACVLFFAPTAATSQTTDGIGEGAGGAANAVAVLGTKPTITGDQSFRVVLRLSSLDEVEIPYAVLYTNYGSHGWEAVTSRQRVCTVRGAAGISNAPHFFGSDANANTLERYDGSQASMGRNRPVYLVVDFECDGTVLEGDEVSIQTEFYFRLDMEWKKANYLFDKRVLAR